MSLQEHAWFSSHHSEIYINHTVAREKLSSAIFKVKEDSILNF